MNRQYTCCFTGHRPDKLPWRTDTSDPRCLDLIARIEAAVQIAYEMGFRHFICGMARGCDLYFCSAVLALRDRSPDVTVEAAVPCPNQSARWPAAERAQYARLLALCDETTLIQQSYTRSCMMRRNRYMVDRSNRVISVYNGQPRGGTYQTLTYAMRQGLVCDVIHLE